MKTAKTFIVWRFRNMLNGPKRCTKCKRVCNETEFHVCSGRPLSECKECRRERSRRDQKKYNDTRNLDPEAYRAYRLGYYHQNKDKFAEYRANFRERHPDYYKNYTKQKKEEQLT